MNAKEVIILCYLLMLASTVVIQIINGHSFEITLAGYVFMIMGILITIWNEIAKIREAIESKL